MTQSAEQSFLRYGSLNHWRGFAALMVMAYHTFWALGFDNPIPSPLRHLQAVLSYGYLGVHLFFVISGYCIAANIHHSIRTTRSSADFIRDRFLRIYPPYWGALMFQTALFFLATRFTRGSMGAIAPESHWALLTNVLLIEPYTHTTRAIIVSWTLVHEFGFYLIVALGFLFAGRARSYIPWLIIGVALAVASFFGLPQPALLVLNYWPEFLLGALVYLARLESHRGNRKLRAAWLSIIPLLAIIALFVPVPDYSRPLPLAAGFALLLFFMAPLDHAIVHFKPLHWLGYVGGFSYSLYLVHAPLLVREGNFAKRFVDARSVKLLGVIGVMWLITIALAWVFYRFCEVPLERLRFSLRHRHPAQPATPVPAQ